jgi:phosphoribosylanthranilate isomerase
MFVKICGLICYDDVLLCDSEGADFLGFIFVEGSKRFVLKPEEVLPIKTRAKKVAVLRNPEKDAIKGFVGFDYIQLHGLESEKLIYEVKSYNFGVIKTIFPDVEESIKLCEKVADYVDFFLVDSSSKLRGFESSLFSEYGLFKIIREGKIFGREFFISGGLNPLNVCEYIKKFKPGGVDVASGVEDEFGRKSPRKVRDFIKNAKSIC